MVLNMGRTKRKRLKRGNQNSIDKNDVHLIYHLQKWMSKNGWNNNLKLKIQQYEETGRGICSKTKIIANDIIISIPIEIIITYDVLRSELVIQEKLTMHEYLAVFLAIEKRKGSDSNWSTYIDSLPENSPPLPWLTTSEEIDLYPPDLRIVVKTITDKLNIFLRRVNKSIATNCALNDKLLRWAYAMVNTRAVYIDPKLFCIDSSFCPLIDEPSMALCPFLDMFNHHHSVETEALLEYEHGRLFYQLKTLSDFKMYDQVFISYGRHDNVKLLTEYGFFIHNNPHDTITFSFEDLLLVLKFQLNKHKYGFIKKHGLQQNLYIGYDGASYSLKAVLYLGYFSEINFLDSIIFSDNYPVGFLKETLPFLMQKLLEFKSDTFENDLTVFNNAAILSDCAKNVLDFVNYRINFINELKTLFYDC